MADIKQKILNYAYGLLARREYSVYDIEQKLCTWLGKHFPSLLHEEGPVLVQSIILELKTKKYLSDERFTRLFVEQKKEINGWGKQKIWQKLREKGIEESLFQANWENHDTTRISSKIKFDVQKKWKVLKTKKKTDSESRQALLRFLAGRGFGYVESQNILDVVLISSAK
jgi:SOS response regulatory protein OraA/RecX